MKRLIPIFVLIMLSGCATMAGMRTEPLDAGVAKEYTTDLRTAAAATRTAMIAAALELEDVEQPDDATWVFYAKRKMQNWTYGELVRVVVIETADNVVTVRILSKRRAAINVSAKDDWSQTIFTQLALDLEERR